MSSKMDHYAMLAKKHGLSVSGVRHRLKSGKPLTDGWKQKQKNKPQKSMGKKSMDRLCLSCAENFSPCGKFNRICPKCSGDEIFRAGIWRKI